MTGYAKPAQELRNDRLRPLAKESAEVCGELRQESNVDLGPVQLAAPEPSAESTSTSPSTAPTPAHSE